MILCTDAGIRWFILSLSGGLHKYLHVQTNLPLLWIASLLFYASGAEFRQLCAYVQGVVRNMYYRNGCLTRDSIWCLWNGWEVDMWGSGMVYWRVSSCLPGSNTFFLTWNNISPSGDWCIPTSVLCAYEKQVPRPPPDHRTGIPRSGLGTGLSSPLHETRHIMRRGPWDFWTRGGPFDSFLLRDSGNLFSSFILILMHLPPLWDLANSSFPYIYLHLLLSPSISLVYFAHQYNYWGVWW